MTKSKLRRMMLMALATAGNAHASVDLVATGEMDGHLHDRSAQTAAPLENGVAGNLLGGIGSGLAYAGCDTFLALPDRGPNATTYNPRVDDTASYIDRFHTLDMKLVTSQKGAPLPFALTPQLRDTTLLFDPFYLYYGNGRSVDLPSGRPRLDRPFRHYFTGRSDNAVPSMNSAWPLNARLDPESIRVSADGHTVYICDEYGSYVYAFGRKSGQRTAVYPLPEAFRVARVAPTGDDEIALNASGRLANKGMEGLAITPDGRTLYGSMQSPLIQDGGKSASVIRIVKIDLRTHHVSQYAYTLTNIGKPTKPKYGTVSEIVAVNDHQLLVDERDGNGFGDDSEAGFKHIFLIDLKDAVDVGKLQGEAPLTGVAVPKVNFLDVLATRNEHGVAAADVPAKLEGLAFGPDIKQNGKLRHTLFVSTDNDFLPTVTDDLHLRGADNPNRFYVFAFDAQDLPGYRPQHFDHLRCDHH
ncbi:MAG: esterase-like activity of phytase family protein [Rhodanobacter sp.]